jgi:hypothetical protein
MQVDRQTDKPTGYGSDHTARADKYELVENTQIYIGGNI